ncbi:MAG: hypothetical protein H6643_14615 [Caldilineaceae bacterium]|nr:hypothetical protein [Caldilineaceae bacterium]
MKSAASAQLQAEMGALGASSRASLATLDLGHNMSQVGLVIAFTSPDAEVLIEAISRRHLRGQTWFQVQQALMAELDGIFQTGDPSRTQRRSFILKQRQLSLAGKVDAPEPDELRVIRKQQAVDAYEDVH